MIVTLNPEDEQAAIRVEGWISTHNSDNDRNIKTTRAGELVPVILFEGDTSKLSESQIRSIEGVEGVERKTHVYKTIARHWKEESNGNRVHRRPDVVFPIGGPNSDRAALMGDSSDISLFCLGVCTVESEKQTLDTFDQIAVHLQSYPTLAGRVIGRGGLWKPRTTRGTFTGLHEEGINILYKARDGTGIPMGTEIMDKDHIGLLGELDYLWVGADNWANQTLLEALGEIDIPVGYKSPKWEVPIETWLQKSYFIAGERTESRERDSNLFYIHRGTVPNASDRSLMDPGFMDKIRELVTLPGMIDVSHTAGDYRKVPKYINMAMEQNPHGIMCELVADGYDRSQIQCDGAQAMYVSDFFKAIEKHV